MYLKLLHTLHKLLFAKLCTCYCVCSWFDQPSLKNSLSFIQNIFDAWESKENGLKILILGKLGSKQVFLKRHFISYSCFFFHLIQCFEQFLRKKCSVFQKLIFPEFRPIEPVFRSIEIAIKICYESLSASIGAWLVLDQSKHFRPIKSNFRSVENHIEGFLKTEFLTCSSTFSILFKLFLSLFDRSKAPSKIFVVFLHNICKFFLLQGR